MHQAHVGSYRGSHLGNWLAKQRPPSERPRHPQSFTASPLKHPSAQKDSQLDMENHRVALKAVSPACPQLNSHVSFPWEIKAIVSTLCPDPRDLKQTAYATRRLRLGTQSVQVSERGVP